MTTNEKSQQQALLEIDAAGALDNYVQAVQRAKDALLGGCPITEVLTLTDAAIRLGKIAEEKIRIARESDDDCSIGIVSLAEYL